MSEPADMSFMTWGAVAVVTAWVLGFPAQMFLRRLAAFDRPNERSSHSQPTIRGGGLAIVAAVIASQLALGWQHGDELLIVFSALVALLAGVSFLDDLRSVSVIVRLFVQIVVAGVLIGVCSGVADTAGVGWFSLSGIYWWLASIFMVCWLVGLTNAFNFMDGINGLATGQAFMVGIGTCLLGCLAGSTVDDPLICSCAVVAGASLGFLPHNFPNARMFLGDVGSASLGFLLAAFALLLVLRHGLWIAPALALLHFNFAGDASITLVRRIISGERWYAPHREHFYQRLVRAGLSHTTVTLVEMGLQLVTLAIAVVSVISTPSNNAILVGCGLFLWIGFFIAAEIRFVRSMAGDN